MNISSSDSTDKEGNCEKKNSCIYLQLSYFYSHNNFSITGSYLCLLITLRNENYNHLHLV